MFRFSHLSSLIRAAIFFVPVCTSLNAQEETQTFDSAGSAEAAGWIFNDEAQNPERECDGCETDLGWKASNNAGGAAAGEAGGLLHRSFSLPIGFYADTTIGELTLEMPFSASGKIGLENIDFDGHAYLGFFNAETLLDDPFDFGAEVGFCIAEPGGGVEPNFRWGHLFTGDDLNVDHSNVEFLDGIPDGEPLDFALSYDPDDGDGAFTFVMGDEPEVFYALSDIQREEGATVNAFGIFTSTHGGGARPDSMEVFIDDVTYTSLNAGPRGDFNLNGELDAMDVDLLSKEVVAGTNDPGFDLTGDALVNEDDRTEWVSNLKNTWFGDANLDGEFNSGDFVEVFTAGEYEDATIGNSGWAEGDWSGDMEFDSADFVIAFIEGGYEKGPMMAAAAVPEPSAGLILLTGFCCLALAKRRR